MPGTTSSIADVEDFVLEPPFTCQASAAVLETKHDCDGGSTVSVSSATPSSTPSNPRNSSVDSTSSLLQDRRCVLPGHVHLVGISVREYLKAQLDVSRLDNLDPYLWMAGFRRSPEFPCRSLQTYRALQLTLVVHDQTELHMTSYAREDVDNILFFVKPLPHWLLYHDFWMQHLCTPPSDDKRPANTAIATLPNLNASSISSAVLASMLSSSPPPPLDATLALMHAQACGLLLSYTDLVASEGDFAIAIELRLLPMHLTWPQWAAFAADVRAALAPELQPLAAGAGGRRQFALSPRWYYGALRIGRVNKISIMLNLGWPRRPGRNRYIFFRLPIDLTQLVRRNLGLLVLVFAYVSIMLTALQVLVATKRGEASGSVQAVSVWLSVLVLGLMVFGLTVTMLPIIVVLIFSILSARNYEQRNRKETLDKDRALD